MGCNTSQEQTTAPVENGDATTAIDAKVNGDDGEKIEQENHHHHPVKQAENDEMKEIKTQKEQQNNDQQKHSDKSSNKLVVDENNDDTGGSGSDGKTEKINSKNEDANKPDTNTNMKIAKTSDGAAGDESAVLNGLDEFGDEEVEAATKIQAVFRGHKARADMKQGDSSSSSVNGGTGGGGGGGSVGAGGTKASAPLQEPLKQSDETTPTKEELEAEFDPNDKELCEAAVRIQSTFRGHLARKLAGDGEGVKDADLQEITKKVAEELDIDLTDPELNKAATKIQASFRGHKARRETDDEK